MGKVLISVLGITDYRPCTYVLPNGLKVENVRFVQEATVKYACSDWTADDRIRILTTEEAYQKSWLDGGHNDDRSMPSFEGLKTRLEKVTKADSDVIMIPKGESEDEIWTIFQAILNALNPDDTVAFDITHGFRSLPMLVMVVLQYARTTMSINLAGIYYGAYEARKNNEAPVFDLTPFDNLVSWSNAIHRFLSSGDASDACKLAKDRALPVLRETKGADQAARGIRDVADRLERFTKDIVTCRGLSLSKNAADLKRTLANCRNTDFAPAFGPLLRLVEESLAHFDGDEINDGIAAATWCREHNLIQQGYTILREILISHACRERNAPPIDPDGYRRGIEKALGTDLAIFRDFKQRPAKYSCGEESPLLHFRDQIEIVQVFGSLGDDRNDLNHAGMRKDPKQAETFLENLPRQIAEVERIIGIAPEELP